MDKTISTRPLTRFYLLQLENCSNVVERLALLSLLAMMSGN